MIRSIPFYPYVRLATSSLNVCIRYDVLASQKSAINACSGIRQQDFNDRTL